MKNKILANLALFVTAFIWGISFVAQREGMEHIGPFTFNMVRSFLGTLSLLPVVFWVKFSKPEIRCERRRHFQHINLARAGIGCGLALFTAMSIQQYCMQYVTAGKAGFISALYIVFVPVITVLQGRRLQKNVTISVFLALVGLYLLCYKSGGDINVYDIVLLAGAFFYGVHILVVNYYSDKVHPVKASCMQFFVVGVLSAILTFMFENPSISSILSCKVSLLYAGILTCGVAYTLQIYGQKNTFPVIASLIFSLEAVFAVLGGAVILGETMVPKEILGCIFMIVAVIVSNFKHEKRF